MKKNKSKSNSKKGLTLKEIIFYLLNSYKFKGYPKKNTREVLFNLGDFFSSDLGNMKVSQDIIDYDRSICFLAQASESQSFLFYELPIENKLKYLVCSVDPADVQKINNSERTINEIFLDESKNIYYAEKSVDKNNKSHWRCFNVGRSFIPNSDYPNPKFKTNRIT